MSVVGLPGKMLGRVEWERLGVSFLDLLPMPTSEKSKIEELDDEIRGNALGGPIRPISILESAKEQGRERDALFHPVDLTKLTSPLLKSHSGHEIYPPARPPPAHLPPKPVSSSPLANITQNHGNRSCVRMSCY